MAITKSNLSLNFTQGVNTKTDPWQITPGEMLELSNCLFNTSKLLAKRNGFVELAPIPDLLINTVTTFKTSLTAIGASLYAYVPEIKTWYNKGLLTSVNLSVQPVGRSGASLTNQDSATTLGGLSCVAWESSFGGSAYQIVDSINSQIVVAAIDLPATAVQPKVSILNRYFVITFVVTVSGSPRLQYIAVPISNPTSPTLPVTMATQITGLTAPYDVVVANNTLYVAYKASSSTIRLVYLSSTLGLSNTVILAGQVPTVISLAADSTGSTPDIWLAFAKAGPTVYAAMYSATLISQLAPTLLDSPANAVPSMTGQAANGVLTLAYGQRIQSLPAPPTLDHILTNTITSLGVIGTPVIVARGLGLASEMFVVSETPYVLTQYNNTYQPTYFLLDLSTGKVVAKLAYQNAGIEPARTLPTVSIYGSKAYVSYLYKDLTTAANKSQGTSTPGIYSQTGVNVVQFDVNTVPLASSEIANNLHLSGGYLTMYDGGAPVEHGFLLYPEGITLTPGGGGSMSAQQYYYQVTYEWTDAQGNLHRSAPSIPQEATLGGSSVTLIIPTLRVTQKKEVRIVVYRWSVAQQAYYQVTSITAPLMNDPTVDSITYLDTQADSSILGNQLIYTTGGVIENVAAPACTHMCLFKSRLFLIDAEDENVIWFSKQVIEAVPVETSDLFTIFAAPSQGSQANTGGAKVLAALDDKLIVFKSQAAYYVTGSGPDNTGAQNDFSDPVIISATVGCANPQSLVLIPNGLMFQSDKGIWLLGRDLSTTYIGSNVEKYNNIKIISAVNVSKDNQVRFSLADGTMLMYDYFYGLWGTFTNLPAESGTMFQNLHTYVDQFSRVFQESPGKYLDGSKPVLLSFKTGWFSLAGLQGLERAYFFQLLGRYITPHTLTVGIAINYINSVLQTVVIHPDNFTPNYGDAPGPYGAEDTYGGIPDPEQWRIFFETQKVESFQLTVSENYDASFGVQPGAGLTLSGINLVVGAKKSYTTTSSSRSTG